MKKLLVFLGLLGVEAPECGTGPIIGPSTCRTAPW